MTDPVKRRPYTSAIRAQRAQRTQERVLAAARRLFGERGYVGTTVEDIAKRARVAPATVYLAFGSKRAVLIELVATAAGGPEVARLNAALLAEPVARRRLALAAKVTRVITEGAWDVMQAIRGGAATERDLAEAWQQGEEARHAVVARAIRPLTPAAARADGEAMVDLVWALTGPDLYRALVVDRGWSADHYEEILSQLLLAAVRTRRGRKGQARGGGPSTD